MLKWVCWNFLMKIFELWNLVEIYVKFLVNIANKMPLKKLTFTLLIINRLVKV